MTLQPYYKVREHLDFKSIGGCIASILLAGFTQPQGWFHIVVEGLTPVALLSTILYNVVRTLKEIFDRKNKP